MDIGAGTYLLGYLAGLLSTLSPCVLALLPILAASALAEHRAGPLALAGGLTVSFVAFGLFFATIGLTIGFDHDTARRVAALMLVLFGAFMFSGRLQARFERATAGLGAAGDRLITRLLPNGPKSWGGPFIIGLCLGLVWTPCVGPTMGAAMALAAQRTQLAQVAVLMGLFGLGASTPLLFIGGLSRHAFARLRGPLVHAGGTGRRVFGGLVAILGLVALLGLDRDLEAWLVDLAPRWLGELSTRF